MDSISIEILWIIIVIAILIATSILALSCISMRQRGATINDLTISSSNAAPDVCQPTVKENNDRCTTFGKRCSGLWKFSGPGFSIGRSGNMNMRSGGKCNSCPSSTPIKEKCDCDSTPEKECKQISLSSLFNYCNAIYWIIGIILVIIFVVFFVSMSPKSSPLQPQSTPIQTKTELQQVKPVTLKQSSSVEAPIEVKLPLRDPNKTYKCGDRCGGWAASGYGMPNYIKTIGNF